MLVNEFGDAGLDPLFIQGSSEEMLVLKSGCVCCTIRSDLPSTLLRLLEMRGDAAPPLGRIVIETSGISEPLPILETLRGDLNLRTRFSAGAIVCVVDALGDAATRHRHEALAQITGADAIAIAKGDIAGDAATRAIEAEVTQLNPLAEIVAATGEGFVRWLATWEAAPHRATPAQRVSPQASSHAAHSHGVRSIAIRSGPPPSWSKFAVWLTRIIFLHGDRILRTKGVLFDPERETWIGIHGVKRFFHPPVHLLPEVPPPDGTCLVFITENLDPGLIEESYRRMVEAS